MGENTMAGDNVEATRAALIKQIEQLCEEIQTLSAGLEEALFWIKPVEGGNSVGHLVLHLTGNLNHWAGARLGNTGYVRNRDREFAEPQPPSKEAALMALREAVAVYSHVVRTMPAGRLMEPHPDASMGSVLEAFFKMLTHFAVHRGQMSYIVKMVKKANQGENVP